MYHMYLLTNYIIWRCNWWTCGVVSSQARLLGVPLSGQQREGSGIRLLLLSHPGHAGRQPVLHLLLGGPGGCVWRGASRHGGPAHAEILGLRGRRAPVSKGTGWIHPKNEQHIAIKGSSLTISPCHTLIGHLIKQTIFTKVSVTKRQGKELCTIFF